MVALADVAVYRGHGFAGYAALFVGAPILLLFGAPQPRFSAGLWAVGVMLAASAVRLAWCGWGLPVACGMVLLVAFAMVLAGIRPYLVELVVFASQSILSGYEGLAHYLAHQYNVRRIMAGDSAPSVQISVHPIDSEGVLSLLLLVDCPDPIVRAGVVAMLADRHEEVERLAENRKARVGRPTSSATSSCWSSSASISRSGSHTSIAPSAERPARSFTAMRFSGISREQIGGQGGELVNLSRAQPNMGYIEEADSRPCTPKAFNIAPVRKRRS